MKSQDQQPASRTKTALGLFWQFFRFSCYTFGGGWPIVAQIQRVYVEEKHWLTEEDLLDLSSVGRSLPGLMIGNVSYLFGYHLAGVPGAIACVLGITIPPLLILTVVTWFYTQFRDNVYISRAMAGIRASVVPVIASAAVAMRKGALKDVPGYVLLLLGFVLYLFFGISCVWIVLLGALLGIALHTWQERRKGGSHGSP